RVTCIVADAGILPLTVAMLVMSIGGTTLDGTNVTTLMTTLDAGFSVPILKVSVFPLTVNVPWDVVAPMYWSGAGIGSTTDTPGIGDWLGFDTVMVNVTFSPG